MNNAKIKKHLSPFTIASRGIKYLVVNLTKYKICPLKTTKHGLEDLLLLRW